MSSTNKTAELHLSQFIGTDIPSILTDYNGDMQKIDAGVREVKQATAGAVSDLSSVTARVTNAEQDISGLNTTVQGIATRVVGAEGDIDNLQSGVSQVQGSVSQLQGNVSQIEEVIPSNASSSNKLATMADIGSGTAELEEKVSDIENVIPDTASISNKVATRNEIPDIYAPTHLSYSDPIDTTSFFQSDYDDFGTMCKAVYDYIVSLYTSNPCNMGVILRVISGNDSFLMYPVDNRISGIQTEFTFTGFATALGSSTPIKFGYLSVRNNKNSAYFTKCKFTFANSYWNADSPTTADGAITGYELRYQATDTTNPITIEVYKMSNIATV